MDADNPTAGLDVQRGSILAARCDGSVFRLPAGTNPETIKALVTRAGDEVIEQ
jgi:hypothetical protein